METIFRKLRATERAASRILEDAKSQTAALDEEQKRRISAYDEKANDVTAGKLARLRRELAQKRDAELKELKNASATKLSDLNAFYEDNHEALAQQIFEQILRK